MDFRLVLPLPRQAFARAVILLAMLLSVAPPPARADEVAPTVAAAAALYDKGQKDESLRMAEAILQKTPNDFGALYLAARIEQDKGHVEKALKYAETLGKDYRGVVVSWELLAQLYQATGQLDRRDSAVRELISTQRSALDPAVRARPYILRDRIDAYGHSVVTRENFDTGGNDYIKYLFVPVQEMAEPSKALLLIADDALTQSWIESGMLPAGKRLFHLDSIYRIDGNTQGHTVYQIYTDLPDYDTIRAKVLEIMSGKAKPLSGQQGGLAVPAGS